MAEMRRQRRGCSPTRDPGHGERIFDTAQNTHYDIRCRILLSRAPKLQQLRFGGLKPRGHQFRKALAEQFETEFVVLRTLIHELPAIQPQRG
jgi:hypothetical protein